MALRSRVTAVRHEVEVSFVPLRVPLRWREARQRDQKLFELHFHFKEPAFALAVLPEAARHTFGDLEKRLYATPEPQERQR